MSGYVYVLSNASMPGLLKIGRTRQDPFSRAQSLRTTGVPTPFRVEFCLWSPDPAGLEMHLHQTFASRRIERSREFFQMKVHEVVLEALNQSSQQVVEQLIDPIVETTSAQNPTVPWYVVRAAFDLLLKPSTEGRGMSPILSTHLTQLIKTQGMGALTAVMAAVNEGHQQGAAILVTQVLIGSVKVEPGDWLKLLVMEGGPTLFWAVQAAPTLRPALANIFLTLLQEPKRLTPQLVLGSTDLMRTGNLNPTDILNRLQLYPNFVSALSSHISSELASPWLWRSLHVPSPMHLRRLCIWRDLLTLQNPDMLSTWPTKVRGWPSHIWPPEHAPQLSQMTVTNADHVVKYWSNLKLEG
nr:GIY-YIG nuclease family protein [Deinococcus aerophilus]